MELFVSPPYAGSFSLLLHFISFSHFVVVVQIVVHRHLFISWGQKRDPDLLRTEEVVP